MLANVSFRFILHTSIPTLRCGKIYHYVTTADYFLLFYRGSAKTWNVDLTKFRLAQNSLDYSTFSFEFALEEDCRFSSWTASLLLLSHTCSRDLARGLTRDQSITWSAVRTSLRRYTTLFIKHGHRCAESFCGPGVFAVLSKWKCPGTCGNSVKRETFICAKRLATARLS